MAYIFVKIFPERWDTNCGLFCSSLCCRIVPKFVSSIK